MQFGHTCVIYDVPLLDYVSSIRGYYEVSTKGPVVESLEVIEIG